MTREECIALLNRYANYNGIGITNLEGCKEATKMAADLLSQPSLPSDLDEAARSRMRDPDMYLSDAVIGEIGDELLKMAHFGAEWMDGQGAKAEGWLARQRDSVSPNLCLYDKKPIREDNGWGDEFWNGGLNKIPLNPEMFPDLTWEDEPIKVEYTIRKK